MSLIQPKLIGSSAFYLQPDCRTKTLESLGKTAPPPCVYKKNFSSLAARIVRLIASIIIFPIALYNALHCLISLIVIPASLCKTNALDLQRLSLLSNLRTEAMGFSSLAAKQDWNLMRTAIKVDGTTIDVLISGTPSSFKSKRWTLFIGGSGEPYEHSVDESLNLLADLKSNGIYFNYPGVGSSSGFISKEKATNAFRAVLSFLEDREKGIGAEEIVLFGWSIGGAIQREALKNYSLRSDVRCIAVSDRTPADYSKAVAYRTNRFLAFLIKFFGWNLLANSRAKPLSFPEIVLQSSQKNLYEELCGDNDVIDDGMIPRDGSYAKEILQNIKHYPSKKMVLAAPPSHCALLSPTKPLADRILTLLRPHQPA